MTYLSAELGTEDGIAVDPDPIPTGWDEYVGPFWQRWSMGFHRLSPANAEMSIEELAMALADLCPVVKEWLFAVGVDWNIDELDRESIFWLKPEY